MIYYILIYLLIGAVFNILLWHFVFKAVSSIKIGFWEEFWTVVLWPFWFIAIFLVKGDKKK